MVTDWLQNFRQQMCYYERKLFGGYLSSLLDRILADCCPSPLTYLNTTFLHAVPPDASIHLRARREKVGGRKVYLAGSAQIPRDGQGELPAHMSCLCSQDRHSRKTAGDTRQMDWCREGTGRER
ncbi:hypothetical protein BDW62DRAFT_17788 [Aspergillus aurantiobrunneus]